VSSPERLLLDEMFAPMLAQRLCAEGFDVIAVAGHVTLAAASDGEVRRWAATHDRRLVTENVKDFQPLVQLAGEPAALLLFTSSRQFPRTRRNPSLLLAALRHWLTQPADHAGPTAWLS
jgi:predicted nuclease of predicted toxin-antitoxin system